MSNIGITYFSQVQNVYSVDIGSRLPKTLWDILLLVAVDLTTVKILDQKGERNRDDLICGSWKYIL